MSGIAAHHKARIGDITDDSKRKIQVRLLQDERDIEFVWPLFESFHKESRYRKIAMKKEVHSDYIRRHFLERSNRYGCIIADLDNRPVGTLYCVISRLLYSDCKTSSALGFYVSPAVRESLLGGRVAVKLLHAYRNWSKERGAQEIQLHVTQELNVLGTDEFLRKLQFRRTGSNYSMEI